MHRAQPSRLGFLLASWSSEVTAQETVKSFFVAHGVPVAGARLRQRKGCGGIGDGVGWQECLVSAHRLQSAYAKSVFKRTEFKVEHSFAAFVEE